MRPIKMVDTKTQYHRIKAQVDAAVSEVLESSAFINGKIVVDFIHKLSGYLGMQYGIPCANGTDALQIAMMGLDLKPGDEVITPSFTYIATTEVIALLGLTPVFTDVDEKTFCMDPDSLRKAITPRTKAIVPVHLYGHPSPMDEILEIAREFNLHVIEDNAQAIGADYISGSGKSVKTGSMGVISCTSFYPSKNLGAFGDGGAIFTNNETLADKMKMIANHGQSRQYYHDIVGCNSRLDSIQAAILDVKLKYLDEYIEARRTAADRYDEGFKGQDKIVVPFRASYGNHAFHQYTIRLKGVDRDGLKQYLTDNEVPSMIYYPVPGHRQKMFEKFQVSSTKLPVTDMLTGEVLSLPMHTELEEDQLAHIINKVLEYVNQ